MGVEVGILAIISFWYSTSLTNESWLGIQTLPPAFRGLEVLEYLYGLLTRFQYHWNASMNIFFSTLGHRKLFMRFFVHTLTLNIVGISHCSL